MSSQTSQSSQSNVDPDLLDQTRQQIRGLVSEIEALSRSDVAPPEFYEGFLNRVVQALAAEGGAVWILGEGGRLELAYQINLRLTRLADRREDQEKHGRLLRKIITSGEGNLAAPYSGDGDGDGQTGNPTEYLLVMGPLRSDQDVQGIVEVFQRPNPRPAVERGYLRFVQQMCDLAGDYLKTHSLRLFTDRQVMWTQLEQFTRMVHQALDPRATAYTIANEGRRLIECDRVTVAVKHGSKSRVEAISGQETFDRRSNTVALLDKLASVVVSGGEPVWYSGDTSSMAPQVESALEAYVDESHTKAMAILPLAKPRQTEDSIDHPKPAEYIGALIIEQITDEAFTQGMIRRIEVVRDHCSSAMSNSIEHQSLFLMPVWRTLGKTRAVVAARNLPKTLTVVGILVAIVAAMFLVPRDFKLEARGALEPVVKRDIFASVGGQVVQIHTKPRQDVEEGEVLLTMKDPDLNVQYQQVLEKIDTARGQISGWEAQHFELKRRPQGAEALQTALQMAKIEGDIEGERMTLQGLRVQSEILENKLERLIVRSPMKGQILTWQVRDKLENRPVEKGQVLLTIADPTQDWDLELKLPEDRMGHILRAMKEQGTEALDVEYIAATDPGVTRWGKIKSIHSIAEVHGEEGNIVLVRVKIDKSDLLTEPMRGATVTAKIHCGRTNLGYSLFHDLISWFQSRVLFRI